MARQQTTALVEPDETDLQTLERLPDDDVVGVDARVRSELADASRRLDLKAREVVIFIHRRFALVAYDW